MKDYLNKKDFESCITHGCFVARPDILISNGKNIYLIEVKWKVGNSEQHRAGKMLVNAYGNVRAAYREILYDLAFQTVLLERAFPNFTIIPYFLMPDECTESKTAEVAAARNEEQVVDFPTSEIQVKENREGSEQAQNARKPNRSWPKCSGLTSPSTPVANGSSSTTGGSDWEYYEAENSFDFSAACFLSDSTRLSTT